MDDNELQRTAKRWSLPSLRYTDTKTTKINSSQTFRPLNMRTLMSRNVGNQSPLGTASYPRRTDTTKNHNSRYSGWDSKGVLPRIQVRCVTSLVKLFGNACSYAGGYLNFGRSEVLKVRKSTTIKTSVSYRLTFMIEQTRPLLQEFRLAPLLEQLIERCSYFPHNDNESDVLNLHIPGGKTHKNLALLQKYHCMLKPVETWRHTRRNQISSFGEKDESI